MVDKIAMNEIASGVAIGRNLVVDTWDFLPKLESSSYLI